MKTLKHLTAALFAALTLALPHLSAAQDAQPLKGVVLDDLSGQSIPLATIIVTGTQYGTAADYEGQFELVLRPEHHMLRISAVGYTSRIIHITPDMRQGEPVTFRLEPSVLNVDEVVVSGDRALVDDPSASSHNQNATEDLMDRIPGADFIQRANFAWEPVIRGMNGGQVGVVIDGMKVVGACIDRMDPTSAYVEVENLERLELTKGGFDLSMGSQIGGTVNLMTQRPSFDEDPFVSTEVGFESASMLRRGRVVAGMAKGKTSVRGSWSYRVADDFSAGGGQSLPGSGYEKNNYKIDATRILNHAHQLTGSFLADNAWGVGYPVLLMDATLAKARISSLTHTWERHMTDGALGEAETRVYYNTVNHWMDDYQRDVFDRPVMRGMYMPMYGKTETAGLISRWGFHFGPSRLNLTLDAYQTDSFGDMWMFSVFENIQDMYLLNLGDIRVRHGAVAADWSTPLSDNLVGRLNVRWDLSTRAVLNDQAVAILQGRWGNEDLARTYSFGNISASFEYALNPITRLRLSLANVARLPTHVENYGHYVYNYVDGFFYTGNPNLKPERSSQMEIGIERWTSRYGVSASVFGNWIRDYIVGLSDAGLSDNEIYRFRVYQNASSASLVGFEVSAVADIARGFSVAATSSYTRGQNHELDEPMFLIPPLSAQLSLRYDRPTYWAEIESRMAMPQERIAESIAIEDVTDGYFIVNARGSYQLQESTSIRFGIDNVFDTFYHEHLSFGNLPNEGRNVYLSVSYTL